MEKKYGGSLKRNVKGNRKLTSRRIEKPTSDQRE
jgi:hypothetical protein